MSNWINIFPFRYQQVTPWISCHVQPGNHLAPSLFNICQPAVSSQCEIIPAEYRENITGACLNSF